jgi:hypothetical protein
MMIHDDDDDDDDDGGGGVDRLARRPWGKRVVSKTCVRA